MSLRYRGPEPRTTIRSRQLRRTATEAEKRLWNQLKDRRLAGYKFVRQEPVGPYFADFLCRQARLVIEVDGGQHCDSEADRRRELFMAGQGYRTLRFWNADVLNGMEGVLDAILHRLAGAEATFRSR